MKKIFFLAAIAAMAMASCGNKATQDPNEQDTVAVGLDVPAEADSITSELTSQLKTKDAAKVEVTLATLQTTYETLVKEGKLEEAKQFASNVQNIINENAETIKALAGGNATVSQLVDAVKKLPVSAEATAEEALAAVNSDAKQIVEAAKNAALGTAEEAANEAVEGVKADVNAKVDEAKANAKAKVDEAKAKANAEVEKAKENAKAKANEAVNNAINDAANKLLRR